MRRLGRWTGGATIALVAVLATGLAACGDDDGGESGGEVFTNSSDPIEVSAGDDFTIELESTPGTGYSWELAEPLPDAIVASLGSDFAHRDDVQPGAPGDQSLAFRAVAAGTATISLQYVRPWEEGVAPAKTEQFSVTVT